MKVYPRQGEERAVPSKPGKKLVSKKTTKTRYLDGEIWCPSCHSMFGQIFRVQVSKDVFEHVTEPMSIPSVCNRCQVVLERH